MHSYSLIMGYVAAIPFLVVVDTVDTISTIHVSIQRSLVLPRGGAGHYQGARRRVWLHLLPRQSAEDVVTLNNKFRSCRSMRPTNLIVRQQFSSLNALDEVLAFEPKTYCHYMAGDVSGFRSG